MPESRWEDLFSELYNKIEYSDITFVHGATKLYCHNIVFKMQAPDLQKKIIENRCNDEINVDHIGISFDTFSEIIKFIYTKNMELDFNNIVEVTQFAHNYNLQSVKEFCRNWIKQKLTIKTACIVLQTMMINNEDNLLAEVENFIRLNYKEVIETESFLNSDVSVIRRILSLEKIESGSEIDVYNAAEKWAKQRLSVGKPFTGSKMRDILGDLIYLIRFPSMTSLEFTECVTRNAGLLKHDEIGAIYLEINAKHENSYGFNSHPRSLKCDNTILRELICNEHVNYQWLNEIPPNTIEFNVSKSITIFGLHITGANHPINVVIKLFDDKNILIAQGHGQIPQQNYKRIDLNQPIQLSPTTHYKIILDYDILPEFQYWCYQPKSVPWSSSICNIEFNFTKMSQMIHKIYFE